MKKFFVCGLMVLCMTACQQPAERLTGTYSYKISGRVTIDDQSVTLPDEIGAMDVLYRHDSTVLVTMNQLNGGIYRADGIVSGDSLRLTSFERTMIFNLTDSLFDTLHITIPGILDPADSVVIDSVFTRIVTRTEQFDLTVQARGEVLNDNILFTLQYMGKSGDKSLMGNDILMVAKRNN